MLLPNVIDWLAKLSIGLYSIHTVLELVRYARGTVSPWLMNVENYIVLINLLVFTGGIWVQAAGLAPFASIFSMSVAVVFYGEGLLYILRSFIYTHQVDGNAMELSAGMMMCGFVLVLMAMTSSL